MDKHTPEQRRKNMQAVKNKDSKIECLLRNELWQRGLRYRKNVKTVYGHPDIAFIGKKVAVFVDSEFWHGYDWENRKTDIKSHQEFWISKIRGNKERDREEQRALASMGWHSITVWECELKPSKREETLDSIAFTLNHIWLQDHGAKNVPYPEVEEEDMQILMAAEECL